MNELTNPLQTLIQQAARSTPAVTGETERFRERASRAGTARVLLCDISGSMAESAGAIRRIDYLHEAMDHLGSDLAGWIGIAFNSAIRPFTPAERPRFVPCGGTAMHFALHDAAAHRPIQTLVISDGRPDSESEALRAAEELGGRIDVLYCGADEDHQAIRFMQRLARVGGGRVTVYDIRRHAAGGAHLLAGTIRKALALPAGGAS